MTTVQIDLSEDGKRYETSAPHLLTESMKRIAGARYLRPKDRWVMPAWAAQTAQLVALLPEAQWSERALARRGALRRWASERRPEAAPELAEGLFDFQAEGALALLHARRLLLLDEPGLGKTVQALAAIRAADAFPALVVTTSSMKYRWATEAERWAPDARVFVVDGTAPKRDKILAAAAEEPKALVVLNWDLLRRHSRLSGFGSTEVTGKEAEPGRLNEIDWAAVVADEAHRAKEPTAKQTRALWEVSKRARIRVAMTGTPVVNSPDDLWSLLRFVAPEEAGSRSQFRDRYCLASPGWHGGIEVTGMNPRTERELRSWLDPRMVRRTKAEVLPQLPPKTVEVRTVDLLPAQAKAYKELKRRMLADIDGELLAVTDPLALVGRLRLVASAVPVIGDSPTEVTALAEPSNKINAMLEVLAEDPGAPVVVFAESRMLIELAGAKLEAAGLRVGYVTGRYSAELREIQVREFQEGKLDAMLCTIAAGGEGITLTRASRALFLQRSWSNAANRQAEDRIHRIGQASSSHITVLVSAGTVDELVERAVQEKEGWLQEIVRDRDRLKAVLKA